MNYSKVMNRFSAVTQLHQLKDHIDALIEEIEKGEYDLDGALSYQTGLADLFVYLNRAWHYSKLNDDQIKNLDHNSFEKITYSIPKLDGNFELVEPNERIE